jgi:hypothetical protein
MLFSSTWNPVVQRGKKTLDQSGFQEGTTPGAGSNRQQPLVGSKGQDPRWGWFYFDMLVTHWKLLQICLINRNWLGNDDQFELIICSRSVATWSVAAWSAATKLLLMGKPSTDKIIRVPADVCHRYYRPTVDSNNRQLTPFHEQLQRFVVLIPLLYEDNLWSKSGKRFHNRFRILVLVISVNYPIVRLINTIEIFQSDSNYTRFTKDI